MFTLYPAVGVITPGSSMLVSVDMMGETPGYSEEVRLVLRFVICLYNTPFRKAYESEADRLLVQQDYPIAGVSSGTVPCKIGHFLPSLFTFC
jgi:hypothetical protein